MSKIVWVSYLEGGSPAMVNRKTGVRYINKTFYDTLPFEHKLFIRLHELGHHLLNTTNELEADRFAFEQYSKAGFSLTKAVYALSKILTFNKPGHFIRLQELYKQALKYDYDNNNNINALKVLNMNGYEGSVISDMFKPQQILADDSFLGIKSGALIGIPGLALTKKEKEAQKQKDALKAEKERLKLQRYEAKTEKKQAKADLIGAKAEAKAAGDKTEAGEFMQKASEVVTDIIAPVAEPAKPKTIMGMSKTTFMIVLIVVVLLVIGLVWYFFLRDKK